MSAIVHKKINTMPHLTTGVVDYPKISTSVQIKKMQFTDLFFEPFVFSDCQSRNQKKYITITTAKNMSGVYVMKEIDSNKILHLGSSKKDLYEQISLAVQHYKICSGETSLAVLKVEPHLIEAVMERIRVIRQFELVDETFFKIIPLLFKKEPISVELINFFFLYNECPIGPRPIHRLKTNIAHLRNKNGIYVLQMTPKEEDLWHIEYVGQATDLHKRLHAHFIKSQAEYRPTSNYYHLRETHDFKIGIIDFPRSEKQLISTVENYLIQQWDPPGNRYGRGLTKEEITSLSGTTTGWRPVEVDSF